MARKTDGQSYLINDNTDARTANNIFKKLCEDLKNGKLEGIYNNQNEKLQVEITPEKFRMAYATKAENEILTRCRNQLPKYYFISEDGIVISLSKKVPLWYTGTKPSKEKRNQIRIDIYNTKKRKFVGDTSKGKIQLANYAVVAIVYESLIIASAEDCENIKKYGLEVFGVKNSGYTRNKTEENKGQKGLLVKGKEVIEAKNMMDVHHTEGTIITHPSCLEIIPHWLHDKMKMFTATTNTIKEFTKLVKQSKKIRDYLDNVPILKNGYCIINMANEYNENGALKKYIYMYGINQKTHNQININECKYFKIVPLTEIPDGFYAGIAETETGKTYPVIVSKNIQPSGIRDIFRLQTLITFKANNKKQTNVFQFELVTKDIDNVYCRLYKIFADIDNASDVEKIEVFKQYIFNLYKDYKKNKNNDQNTLTITFDSGEIIKITVLKKGAEKEVDIDGFLSMIFDGSDLLPVSINED